MSTLKDRIKKLREADCVRALSPSKIDGMIFIFDIDRAKHLGISDEANLVKKILASNGYFVLDNKTIDRVNSSMSPQELIKEVSLIQKEASV